MDAEGSREDLRCGTFFTAAAGKAFVTRETVNGCRKDVDPNSGIVRGAQPSPRQLRSHFGELSGRTSAAVIVIDSGMSHGLILGVSTLNMDTGLCSGSEIARNPANGFGRLPLQRPEQAAKKGGKSATQPHGRDIASPRRPSTC